METDKIGTHGYSGNWTPGKRQMVGQLTFSVGIFLWEPASTKVGVKKGCVKVRVSGPTHNPEAVYSKAREVIEDLNKGTYNGPNTIRV